MVSLKIKHPEPSVFNLLEISGACAQLDWERGLASLFYRPKVT